MARRRSRQRRSFDAACQIFGATFRGIDIFDEDSLFPNNAIPRSGLSYDISLERIQAAHWDLMSLKEFDKTERDYQIVIQAGYRTEQQIKAVLDMDLQIRMKKQQLEQEQRNNYPR